MTEQVAVAELDAHVQRFKAWAKRNDKLGPMWEQIEVYLPTLMAVAGPLMGVNGKNRGNVPEAWLGEILQEVARGWNESSEAAS